MLSPQQERFCQNLEVKRMSQYEAYKDAYPASRKWNRETVDVNASKLANKDKILLRRKELRDAENENIRLEAKWTREDAYKALKWLIDTAKAETEAKGALTSPCVSATTGAVKELNAIFAVDANENKKGVLEDILDAVRGATDD